MLKIKIDSFFNVTIITFLNVKFDLEGRKGNVVPRICSWRNNENHVGISVEDLLKRVAEAQVEVYGYADGDSDSSSMDGADID